MCTDATLAVSLSLLVESAHVVASSARADNEAKMVKTALITVILTISQGIPTYPLEPYDARRRQIPTYPLSTCPIDTYPPVE